MAQPFFTWSLAPCGSRDNPSPEFLLSSMPAVPLVVPPPRRPADRREPPPWHQADMSPALSTLPPAHPHVQAQLWERYEAPGSSSWSPCCLNPPPRQPSRPKEAPTLHHSGHPHPCPPGPKCGLTMPFPCSTILYGSPLLSGSSLSDPLPSPTPIDLTPNHPHFLLKEGLDFMTPCLKYCPSPFSSPGELLCIPQNQLSYHSLCSAYSFLPLILTFPSSAL